MQNQFYLGELEKKVQMFDLTSNITQLSVL
jgi:hypothetical protein